MDRKHKFGAGASKFMARRERLKYKKSKRPQPPPVQTAAAAAAAPKTKGPVSATAALTTTTTTTATPLKVPSLTTLSVFTSTKLDDLTNAHRGTIIFNDTKNQVLVWDSEAWSPLFNKDVSEDTKFAPLDNSSNVPSYALWLLACLFIPPQQHS
jgi:hypothetical protein